MSRLDEIREIIEQNTVGKPIVQVDRLAIAIHDSELERVKGVVAIYNNWKNGVNSRSEWQHELWQAIKGIAEQYKD